MNIPNGHQAVMPYLMVNGANTFIDFTKKVFDAEVSPVKMRQDNEKVMHAEIQMNGSTIMFCDTTDQWKTATANMFIYVDNADHTFNKAITEGATIVMELSDQDYGRTCGITDPVGNVWWITSL